MKLASVTGSEKEQPLAGTKKLYELIDKFLKEKRVSDGGWAPVSMLDFSGLEKIVYQLVQSKWGPDPDGDYPINWVLIDRTRFEPLHYQLMPYHKMKPNPSADEWRLERALLNLSIAMQAVDICMKTRGKG